MVYDQRILSWKGLDKVSILTLSGRQIIPSRIGAYQEARIDHKIRQSNLILRDGIFYWLSWQMLPNRLPMTLTATWGLTSVS